METWTITTKVFKYSLQ